MMNNKKELEKTPEMKKVLKWIRSGKENDKEELVKWAKTHDINFTENLCNSPLAILASNGENDAINFLITIRELPIDINDRVLGYAKRNEWKKVDPLLKCKTVNPDYAALGYAIGGHKESLYQLIENRIVIDMTLPVLGFAIGGHHKEYKEYLNYYSKYCEKEIFENLLIKCDRYLLLGYAIGGHVELLKNLQKAKEKSKTWKQSEDSAILLLGLAIGGADISLIEKFFQKFSKDKDDNDWWNQFEKQAYQSIVYGYIRGGHFKQFQTWDLKVRQLYDDTREKKPPSDYFVCCVQYAAMGRHVNFIKDNKVDVSDLISQFWGTYFFRYTQDLLLCWQDTELEKTFQMVERLPHEPVLRRFNAFLNYNEELLKCLKDKESRQRFSIPYEKVLFIFSSIKLEERKNACMDFGENMEMGTIRITILKDAEIKSDQLPEPTIAELLKVMEHFGICQPIKEWGSDEIKRSVRLFTLLTGDSTLEDSLYTESDINHHLLYRKQLTETLKFLFSIDYLVKIYQEEYNCHLRKKKQDFHTNEKRSGHTQEQLGKSGIGQGVRQAEDNKQKFKPRPLPRNQNSSHSSGNIVKTDIKGNQTNQQENLAKTQNMRLVQSLEEQTKPQLILHLQTQDKNLLGQTQEYSENPDSLHYDGGALKANMVGEQASEQIDWGPQVNQLTQSNVGFPSISEVQDSGEKELLKSSLDYPVQPKAHPAEANKKEILSSSFPQNQDSPHYDGGDLKTDEANEEENQRSSEQINSEWEVDRSDVELPATSEAQGSGEEGLLKSSPECPAQPEEQPQTEENNEEETVHQSKNFLEYARSIGSTIIFILIVPFKFLSWLFGRSSKSSGLPKMDDCPESNNPQQCLVTEGPSDSEDKDPPEILTREEKLHDQQNDSEISSLQKEESYDPFKQFFPP